MLRKLLKYDIKYLLKPWIVTAVGSFLLSFVGGYCAAMIDSEGSADYEALLVIGIMLFGISIFCLGGISFIGSFVRFYHNLYTDEGYLTFTLPVRKGDILLSKFLAGIISMGSGAIVIAIDFAVFVTMLYVSHPNLVGTPAASFDPSILPYAIATFFIVLFAITTVTLLAYIMISCGAKYSQMGRLGLIILATYGSGFMFSIVLATFGILHNATTVYWNDIIPEGMMGGIKLIAMFATALALALLSILLYIAEYRLLDKHLNLN